MSRRFPFDSLFAAPLVASLTLSASLNLSALPVHAQPAAPVAPDTVPPVLAQLPHPDRVEGTITFQQGDVSRAATIQFEAPDKLRIALAPDETTGSSAQTLVASGNTVLLFTESTKRVVAYDFNPVQRPWRDANLLGGGPANLSLFGFAPTALSTDYVAQVKAATVALTARLGVGQQLTREDVRFGGTGKGAYYAAYKRASFNRPAAIDLTLANGKVQSRIERDAEGTETGRAVFAYNGALPREVTVQSPQGTPLARYVYDLKARETAFPDATFALNAPNDAVVESASPSAALLAQADAVSASELYNRGIVRWKLTEDYRATVTDLDAAARAQPNATAPLFALCDMALIARDMPRATNALEGLRKLLSDASPDVALRRAQFATLARDWAGAQAVLQPALGAHPTSLPLLLAHIENARARGDFAEAAQTLRAVLQVRNIAPNLSFAAAQSLQHLDAQVDIAPLLGGEALTRWKAREAERGGDFEGALTIWKTLENSPAFGAEAASHEIALYADKGSVADSLNAWLALEQHASSKVDRDRARSTLLNAWRKANRQITIEPVLRNRSAAANATEEDVRLWLNFEQINAKSSDVLLVIQTGVRKFPTKATWQSLLSEALLINNDAAGAMDAVNKAIKLESTQPFYRVQRALILKPAAMSVKGTPQDRDNFNNAVDAIARDFPDDPDAQLSVALSRAQSIPEIQDSIKRISRAFQLGDVNDPNRHGFLLASRQGLASLYRQIDGAGKAGGDPAAAQKAATQYITLINASRSAIEEAAVSSNYIVLFRARKDAPDTAKYVADLLISLADEPWQQSAWRSLLTAAVRALVVEPKLAADVLTELRTRNSPQAVVSATVLTGSLLEIAQAASEATGADAKQEDALRRALAADTQSIAALDGITAPPLLRGHAQALKGESIQATDAAVAATAFGVAVQTEPFDVTTRFNLVKTLIASNQTEAAKTQRTAMLNALLEDYGRLQTAVALALQFGENDEARRVGYATMNTAQIDPDATPADYETAALMAARAAFATGDTQRGAALYTRLSDPQWAIEDRLAALLDWYNRAVEAKDDATRQRIEAQVKALQPNDDQLASARSLSASLD